MIDAHLQEFSEMVARKRITPFYAAPPLQRGYGMPIYRGSALQRGHGLGDLFTGLFRLAAPVLKRTAVRVGKRALKTVGIRALKAGANALSDIAEKRLSPKQAIKTRAKEIFVPPTSIKKAAHANKKIITKKKSKSKVKNRRAPHLP